MIFCDYDFHFKKIRTNDRVLSVPVFKNTCINCKYKNECGVSRFNNPRRNNEVLIKNLLDVKDFIRESLNEARNIQRDIDEGYYSETYSLRVMNPKEAPEGSVVYQLEGFGNTVEYDVDEYLQRYPESGRKLVGIPDIQSPEDVCYGLNIKELESDLEYINEELRKYNEKNKMIKER